MNLMETLRAMNAGDQATEIAEEAEVEIEEAKKLDDVDKGEAKKDFEDREDKDIDNDGDTDDSDKFLHKRRKAVSKALDKEEVAEETEQLDELSPKTMASYRKKAGRSLDKLDKKTDSSIRKAGAAENRAVTKAGNKAKDHDKHQADADRHHADADRSAKKLNSRSRFMDKSFRHENK